MRQIRYISEPQIELGEHIYALENWMEDAKLVLHTKSSKHNTSANAWTHVPSHRHSLFNPGSSSCLHPLFGMIRPFS